MEYPEAPASAGPAMNRTTGTEAGLQRVIAARTKAGASQPGGWMK